MTIPPAAWLVLPLSPAMAQEYWDRLAITGMIAAAVVVVSGIVGVIYCCWSRYTIRGNLRRLSSCSSKVTAAAERALNDLCDKRTVTILLKRLRRHDSLGPTDREVMARLLGRLGDPQAIEPLLGLLADHHRDVRRAAKEALTALGATKEQLIDGYLEALSSTDSYAAREAGEALDALGATKEQLVDAYLKALSARHPWCVPALTSLGLTQEQKDKLAQDMSRGDEPYYNTVSDLLHNLGDPRGGMIYVFHREEGHYQDVSHEAEVYDGYTGPLHTEEYVVDRPAHWEGPVPREHSDKTSTPAG